MSSGSTDGAAAPAGTAAAPAAPLANLPQLHSLPGAPTAIYLDFNGNGANLPYDVDGDRTSFNADEQTTIELAWRHMATYFAPFNVNVTTVLPTVPMAWELISNSISGGYSYVGVFPNNPAGNPQSFNQSADARTRQSGIAHEIGHNFGLSHQSDFDLLGNETADYSSGYDATHGPIMGVDYAQSVHKWFIGHTSSPSALQDDVAIIAARIASRPGGGDGFRPDDFGGNIATASPLDSVGGIQTATGIIERMTDADAFRFTATGGRMALDVNPVDPSGLIPKVAVYDAAGKLLAAKDDADRRNTNNNDVSVPLDLPAGTYYAIITSHGDYGDIGQYEVTASELPGGWSSQWLGAPSLAGGYADFEVGGATPGTFTLAAAGGSSWGTSDQGRYAYTTLIDGGSITARVASLINTDSAARAGLQVRETLTQNARQVTINATPTNGLQFVRRSSVGGSLTTSTTTAAAFTPVYLRITRSGDTFTTARSVDGSTWTTVGSTTIAMASTVYVGLVAHSRDAAETNVATFDSLTTTGGVTPAAPAGNGLPTPAAAPTVAPAATGTGLTVTWPAVAGATGGYAVERSIDGTDFERVATTAAGVTTYTDAGLWGSMRYFYRVRALLTGGGSTASPASAVGSGVNRPNAPSNLTVTSWQTGALILNWRDVSGETGYRIERSTDGGTNWTTVGTVGANVPSFTNSGLATATAYTYRVIPTSAAGDGPATSSVTEGTRLPATTGLALTVASGTRMELKWNPVAGATGYRVDRSTNGTSFTTLTTLASTATTYADTTVVPGGEYYYRVVGTYSQSESMWPTAVFAAAPSASPPAAPWQSADFGTVTGPGATGFSGGTFTLISGGTDLDGSTDHGRFTSMTLVGDGAIVARVVTLEGTADGALAGVMIRETNATGARRAVMAVKHADGSVFGYRTATNGNTATVTTPTGADPYWVRLARAGNTFTGSISSNGVTWTTVGSATVAMANRALIGLVGTSYTSNLLQASTFTNVTVTTAAASIESSAVGDGVSLQRSMVGSFTIRFDRPVAGFDTDAFTLTRTPVGGGPASAVAFVATVAADGLSITLTPAGGSASFDDGTYQVTVTPGLVRDAAGQGGTGSAATFAFHRLFGDADGDGDVDGADSRGFRTALGAEPGSPLYSAVFDWDADGDVDGADSREFRTRLGTSL